jgi:sulfatase maturation enzyme AslB (radical SAM superfamily)
LISCEWIEGGIAFGRDKVHVCCIPNLLNKGGWEEVAVLGDRIDVSEFERVRRTMRGGGCASCKGCAFLCERGRADYPFDRINFSQFTSCQLRCEYCYVTRESLANNHKMDEDRTEKVFACLKQMVRERLIAPDGRTEVYWGGGEPTVSPRFDSIMATLSSLKCKNVVNTNAVTYSQELASALTHIPKTIAIISIDAGDAETYHRIKGANTFERVVENVRKYASVSSSGMVRVKYICYEGNTSDDDIGKFTELSKTLGVKQIVVDSNNFERTSSRVLLQMAKLAKAIRHLGLDCFVGECGVLGAPDMKITETVEELCR